MILTILVIERTPDALNNFF